MEEKPRLAGPGQASPRPTWPSRLARFRRQLAWGRIQDPTRTHRSALASPRLAWPDHAVPGRAKPSCPLSRAFHGRPHSRPPADVPKHPCHAMPNRAWPRLAPPSLAAPLLASKTRRTPHSRRATDAPKCPCLAPPCHAWPCQSKPRRLLPKPVARCIQTVRRNLALPCHAQPSRAEPLRLVTRSAGGPR